MRCALAVALLLSSTSAWADRNGPPRIHVSTAPLPPVAEADRKPRLQETDAERKRLSETRKRAEKAAQTKHGKKRTAWPEETRQQVDEAYRQEGMAGLAHHRLKTDQKELDDSAEDVRDALLTENKKEPKVALADSAEAAALKVEVLARRAQSSFPAAAWILYLKVTPARTVDPAAFAGTSFGQIRNRDAYLGQIMGMQSLAGGLSTLHLYSESEPFWVVEVFQQGTSFWPAAQAAAQALTTFASGLDHPAEEAAAPEKVSAR